MRDGTFEIVKANEMAIDLAIDDLCEILIRSVEAGAAIGFMSSITGQIAAGFWIKDVGSEVAKGRRSLILARVAGKVVGAVQLVTAMPHNQPHRGEISKMMVHPDARRRGIGKALMQTAIDEARMIGKTLITLDTRTGDVAEPLYKSVGFQVSGIIPDYAFDPDGKALHATTYMYRLLDKN